jgi:rhodanese-related sulfurtransferase
MKVFFSFALCLCALMVHSQQFKADNVKYTTVYPEDLCNTLQKNPGYVLLDVRSDGEFYDSTSASPSLNIGHFRDALHIDIRQLSSRWKELAAYKDRPLFIYCSHSQRSRRASRLLADSGFTKLYNINGGLTNFYAQGIEANPCQNFSIVTDLPYKLISPKQLDQQAASGKSYYIIDLRTDSAFRGITTDEGVNAQGHLSKAVNIPLEKFYQQQAFSNQGKPILLVDDYGNDSPVAAKFLISKGIKDVTILFNGMDEWTNYATSLSTPPAIQWNHPTNYTLISADALRGMINKMPVTLIDIRSAQEFSNQSKNYWQNIGQVKNAVNITSTDLKSSSTLPQSKADPVIVYGFNGEPAVYASAKWLHDQGYKKVYVLEGGIWNLRWEGHNVKGKGHLNELVVNVPPENE